ncbi:SRPBCC family protein [Algoriphagus mannitolivorans]|uniref:SRPBCC family protein n=1 Tax=Algoriphagus mannitolivorans TaxID=226504 RepID=UPI0004003F32|nr:SRPBCC family protein [Algoriphagus mannitolivorans]
MKILKITGLILLLAIVGLLLYGLFIPNEYQVLEKITINRPIEEVYDFTKLLKNQDQYSKWQLMDPDMEHYYEGEDGTVGFVSGWKSANPDVGHGEQEILAIQEMERIDYELRFFEPFEGKDKAYMTFNSLGANQTEVGWGFEGKMAYPMNLMIPMMGMEQMIADDFRVGLENLKKLLEN